MFIACIGGLVAAVILQCTDIGFLVSQYTVDFFGLRFLAKLYCSPETVFTTFSPSLPLHSLSCILTLQVQQIVRDVFLSSVVTWRNNIQNTKINHYGQVT